MAENKIHDIYHPNTGREPVSDDKHGAPLYIFSPDFGKNKIIICGHRINDKETLVIHGYEIYRGPENPNHTMGPTVSRCESIPDSEQKKIMNFLRELENKMGCNYVGELIFW